MTLLEQCRLWHEKDQHQKIVDALEAVPEEERTPELDSALARAYNNLADPEKPEGRSHISVMICQNYHPGDSAMGGIGLQGADLILELDEDGDCTLLVEPRD